MTNDAISILSSSAYQVPHAPDAPEGMSWLRASVARFCDGSDHVRRRGAAQAQLGKLDLGQLRTGHGDPTELLAEALGLPRGVAPDVAAAAQSYQLHVPTTVRADHAVERLVTACGGRHDEQTAARIGLLVQAHAAVAALVQGTNPPVPATRRVTPTGQTCRVDLTGVAFGAGAHACPGRSHALALAASQLPFHRLHHREVPLILPNAWDYASAAVLVQAGFEAIGTTSLGVAAANGLPDAAAATFRETVDLAAKLVRLPVPVTVDIEAGLGADPRELAAELWSLGVAGVNIEDGRGNDLADPVEQVAMLRAFKDAAPALFVNARIDTHWLHREMPSTVDRVLRYADAGADGIFVPGLTDDRGIAEVVSATTLPINVLAEQDVQRLANLGVRRISTGSLLFRAALASALAVAEDVRDGNAVRPVLGYQDVQALVGHPSEPGA